MKPKRHKKSGIFSNCFCKQRMRQLAVAMALLLASTELANVTVQEVYASTAPAMIAAGNSTGGNGSEDKEFIDVPKAHWAYENIRSLCKKGVVTGFLDGRFKPDEKVTKAQFNKMLTSVFGYNMEVNVNSTFTDLNDAPWATSSINTALKHDLIPPKYYESYYKPDGKYRPNDSMEREEVAYETWYAIEDALGNGVEAIADTLTFVDKDQISPDYLNAVNKLVRKGGIQGYTNGQFMPHGFVTRAEAVAILSRAMTIVQNRGNTAPDLLPPVKPVVETPKADDVRYSEWYVDSSRGSYRLEYCDGVTKRLYGTNESVGGYLLPLTGKEEWTVWSYNKQEIFVNYSLDDAIAKGLIICESKRTTDGGILYHKKLNFEMVPVTEYIYEFRDILTNETKAE